MIYISAFENKHTVIATGHCDSYFPGSNKISIARIFNENKGRLLYDFELARKGLRFSVMKAINLIILCFLHDLGHSLYECPNCENFTFVRHTCKSRFCTSCGMNYQKIRSAAVMDTVFDCPHRQWYFYGS